MNVINTSQFTLAVFTHREAEEINALLKSPDVETYRWIAGISFRKKLNDAVRGFKGSQKLFSTEEIVVDHLVQSPDGLDLTQLKTLTGMSSGDKLDELCKTVRWLEKSGIVTVVGDTSAIYKMAPGVDPEDVPVREESLLPNDSKNEAKIQQRILDLFNRLPGEKSKTYVTKGLKLTFADADIALHALVESEQLLKRQDDGYTYFRLPGTEPTIKPKREKKGKKASKSEEPSNETPAPTTVKTKSNLPPVNRSIEDLHKFFQSGTNPFGFRDIADAFDIDNRPALDACLKPLLESGFLKQKFGEIWYRHDTSIPWEDVGPYSTRPRPMYPEGHTAETTPIVYDLQFDETFARTWDNDKVQTFLNGAQKRYEYLQSLPLRAAFDATLDTVCDRPVGGSSVLKLLEHLVGTQKIKIDNGPGRPFDLATWVWLNDAPEESRIPPRVESLQSLKTTNPVFLPDEELTVAEPEPEPEPASSWAHLGEGYELL